MKKHTIGIVIIIVAVIILVAYFILSRHPAVEGSSANTGMKTDLLTRYSGQPDFTAAINGSSPDIVQTWWNLVQIWNNHGDPYSIAVDGKSAAPSRDQSIGKWWEAFVSANKLPG